MAQSIAQAAHLDQPVTAVARRDFVALREDFTVQQALDTIRKRDIGEGIVYFYVVDAQEHLVGVLPTRRLLMAELEQRIADIMVPQIITIPDGATVMEALEFFVMHRLLAFPVVDDEQHLVGTVDVGMFTEEVFDITERERTDEVFELIGFSLSQVREAAPTRVFRFRFPWLLATIGSGTICAVLASAFEATLAQSLVLMFFLTLILGLGESVSTQSMTVTIQALRATQPRWTWYFKALRRELSTALLLGTASGGIVALIIAVWRQEPLAALAVGGSILLSICAACLIGLSVPTLLHALRLDPKIAAGPVTLAVADIFTLLFYFGLATLLL
ncbi:MAG: magnesium transporter [Planctomycetes bacterium]|jgi:magnesium transporter|nr:magnesium transporter [Planctomycetota bacterium]